MLNIAFFDTRPLSLPKIDLGKIWSLLKVTEPRFTYVMQVMTTEDDPREPTWLGTVYCDEATGKTLSVDSLIFEKKGMDHKSLFSIHEVTQPEKLQSRMSRKAFSQTGLKAADIDVQDDMVLFLKEEAQKAGFVFVDRRERTQKAGISPNGIPACTLS